MGKKTGEFVTNQKPKQSNVLSEIYFLLARKARKTSHTIEGGKLHHVGGFWVHEKTGEGRGSLFFRPRKLRQAEKGRGGPKW